MTLNNLEETLKSTKIRQYILFSEEFHYWCTCYSFLNTEPKNVHITFKGQSRSSTMTPINRVYDFLLVVRKQWIWVNTYHTHNAVFVAVQFSDLYSLIQVPDTHSWLMSSLTIFSHTNRHAAHWQMNADRSIIIKTTQHDNSSAASQHDLSCFYHST